MNKLINAVVIAALTSAFATAAAAQAGRDVGVALGIGSTHGGPFYTRGTAVAALSIDQPVNEHWLFALDGWASRQGLEGDCVFNCNRTFPAIVGGSVLGGVHVDRLRVGVGPGFFHSHTPAFQPTNAVGIAGALSLDLVAATHATLDVSIRPLLLPHAFGARIWIIPIAVGGRFR